MLELELMTKSKFSLNASCDPDDYTSVKETLNKSTVEKANR